MGRRDDWVWRLLPRRIRTRWMGTGLEALARPGRPPPHADVLVRRHEVRDSPAVERAPSSRLRGHQGVGGQAGGCYTPSAGTVYPTLQLLEDQRYVRGVETDGKRIYHITPAGERFLVDHRDVLDEIFERVRETVRDVAGGAMGDLNSAFAHLATAIYKRAWRKGPEDPAIRRVAEILRKAAEDIAQAWDGPGAPEPRARV